MVMVKNKKFKHFWERFKSYGFNLILLSILTGLFVGVVITFYNICMNYGEEYSRALYGLLLENPAFIPLLFIGLAAGAVVIGTLVRFVPMIRGSGIPQIEGAARGKFGINWYVTMCSMFAASLACSFMGLAAGGEGPAIEMGGCAGEAVGSALKRSFMIKRLQIAGGASAGFAVAFNSPVTGMIFALEEAFKSFSPQVFISSAVSVVTALCVRNCVRVGMGLSIGFVLTEFKFTDMDAAGYGFVALSAVIVALAAVAFYYLMLYVRKFFKKMTFLHGSCKFVIPFLLSGAFGLISHYAMGGGHEFITALASGSGETVGVFGLGLTASLVIIIIMRYASMTMYMSSGVPCGVFIPMLAVGAGLGALLSRLFQTAGFNAEYSDYLIIICMAVFFTTFVRAPITGLCMIFELTGQAANFLPALIGIVIGYMISEICHLEPGYEKMLNLFIEDEGYYKNNKKIRLKVTIQSGAQADGGKVRKIIWPSNGLVVELTDASGKSFVPDGETILRAGDTITFECETSNERDVLDYLYEIVGKPNKY